MVYKCKIFEVVNLTLHGNYTCVYTQVIGINTENNICFPSKKYITGHWWYRINITAKCILHKHIAAELKAYWLTCFSSICSNMGFICSETYICDVTGIFAQGHVSLMWSVCIPLLAVTLIELSWHGVYILT